MESVMNKKYIVRLSDKERQELVTVISKLKGTSQKVKRAQILLKADADGPNWPHHQIAEAYLYRTKTVSNTCKSLVERGFEITLNGKKRDKPPHAKLLDGQQEAKIIALRLGKPPKGYSNWSLRLIADKAVELGIVESISHTTISNTLKKIK
jgi:DNA-binding MarR family transcriptional regulator